MNKKSYKTFEEARSFVRDLNFKSVSEWREFCKSNKRTDNTIPSVPQRTYKSSWVSFGDFLGNGNVATKIKSFVPFEEAKKFVHTLGLQGQREWKKYCKSGNKPDDIPTNPNIKYKNQGWIS